MGLWYFGNIDRYEAEQVVKFDGDYLVRFSDSKGYYVLTTKWEGQAKHFVIRELEDEVRTSYK